MLKMLKKDDLTNLLLDQFQVLNHNIYSMFNRRFNLVIYKIKY